MNSQLVRVVSLMDYWREIEMEEGRQNEGKGERKNEGRKKKLKMFTLLLISSVVQYTWTALTICIICSFRGNV
jgi:hypothetical protein